MATTYFSVTAAMVQLRYRDMDTGITEANILTEAQSQENWIMAKRRITATPSNAIELANMQLATVYLTCAAIEEGEPHEEGEGSSRQSRFNRVLWRKAAMEILDHYKVPTRTLT